MVKLWCCSPRISRGLPKFARNYKIFCKSVSKFVENDESLAPYLNRRCICNYLLALPSSTPLQQLSCTPFSLSSFFAAHHPLNMKISNISKAFTSFTNLNALKKTRQSSEFVPINTMKDPEFVVVVRTYLFSCNCSSPNSHVATCDKWYRSHNAQTYTACG